MTVALHSQWRIVLKGGKTTTVGRRGSAVGACVGHLLVCEETGGVDDWRIMHQWALMSWKNRKKKEERRKKKDLGKIRELVVLRSGEEDPGVLVRDADQESRTRIRENVLRTGSRQAVERATSKRGYHTG
ncbi:hypothetical protein TNCV_408241 [Trichonephila clavipes]|nr:hypothetical protein TNCV_408241 [Trichonephila clavipes]